MKNKFLYNLLSLTWGLPMTLIGGLVALALVICGHRPKRHGGMIYFALGGSWGGISLGRVFLCSESAAANTVLKNHEFGHSFQNCWWGPLFIFVVGIPSFIRCQYREYLYRVDRAKYWTLPDYDAIWFEGQATELGNKYIEYYE